MLVAMRRSVASSSRAGTLGRSTAARALAASSARRKTFTSASGTTTVPMSRPSMTDVADQAERALPLAHDLADLGVPRHTGTSRSISASRIAAVTSSPSTSTCPPSANETGCATRELGESETVVERRRRRAARAR